MNITPDSLRVGLVQCRPVVGDPAANLVRIETVLAGHPDADLLVWPELALCGYTTAHAASLAERIEGAAIARIAELAGVHDTAIVIGFAEARDEGVANSALAIDRDGRVAGCYRKAQLFGDEADAFRPGEALCIASLCGVPVGLMICFDIEFPEIGRALAEAGTALFVSVSANMTPFAPDHRLCVRARALENRRPHVYVNQVGQGEIFRFTGESAVADTAGRVIAECDGESEAVCMVDVPLAIETVIRPDYLIMKRRERLAVNGPGTANPVDRRDEPTDRASGLPNS